MIRLPEPLAYLFHRAVLLGALLLTYWTQDHPVWGRDLGGCAA